MTSNEAHYLLNTGVYTGAGSADDAVRVGNFKCDRDARLSLRTEAAHHSVPDTQERPQADDDKRPRSSGRYRATQEVAVE